MARAASVPNAWQVHSVGEFEAAVEAAYEADGASIIVAKVETSKRRIPYADLEGSENKYCFVR